MDWPRSWAADQVIKKPRPVRAGWGFLSRNTIQQRGVYLNRVATPWADADWSQSNARIAVLMGMSERHVTRMRSIYAPETKGLSVGRPKGSLKLEQPLLTFSGLRLREIRAARGFAQEELSEMIGGSRNIVGEWETGRKTPTASFTIRLLTILKCAPSDIAE